MIAEQEKSLNAAVADLTSVNTTALLTLYCRARESQNKDPIIRDETAVALARQITPLIANSPDRLLRSLADGSFEPQVVVHIAMRAKKYDAYARQFLEANGGGVVVNLGGGMDTRFQRLDDGRLELFDVDLPEMIAFKQRILPPGGRYHQIARSVYDYAWMEEVARGGERPIIFLAEGLFMYLEPEKVRQLVLEMRARFPGAEMVAEVFNSFWLRQPWKNLAMGKMKRRLNIAKDVEFTFGIAESRELESWHPGLKFLDDWSYFDVPDPKLGWMNWFTRFEWVRRVQWSVHYRFA